MKKYLGISVLAFVFFSTGLLTGTGGLNTRSNFQNLDSLQTEAIKKGYTSVIDVWTVFRQVEIFMVASKENIKSTFEQLREDQMKLVVAGLIDYTNTSKPTIYSVDKQSIQINEPVKPFASQKSDFPPNDESINNSN